MGIGIAGGVFAFLAFCHFAADFVFQMHAEAMRKHADRLVRLRHCAVYTALMAAPLWVVGLRGLPLGASLAVLFLSHFVEDTYVPVYLWAKHVRRVPEVRESGREGFAGWIATPLGKILMIVVDQIVHLAFLWIPAWLAAGSGR